ncbi:hypothetical protein R6Q59_029743 [Mikania micrantha]
MAAEDYSFNLDDESEETVSLCDLSVCGDYTYYNPTASEDAMKDDESFEFSSQEWLINNQDLNSQEGDLNSTSSEDSMKDDESFEFPSQECLKNNQDLNFLPNKVTFGGFHQKPVSKNIQEFKKLDQGSSEGDLDSDSSRISEIARLMSINKGRNYVEKHEMKKKMFPDLASKKSRSHSYGIELAGSRPEMDFSAIKSRQNRHRKSNLDGGRKEATGSFRQENWLDRLIKGLSCNYETEASSMKVILDQLP